jgi:hypothetical protein
LVAQGRFLFRSWVGSILVAALIISGCDSSSPYRTLLREQTKALQELASILETVTDKASMKAARVQLDARFEIFDDIRKRSQSLPPPSRDEMQLVQEEGAKLQQVLDKVQEQIRRISALPDGSGFLESLKQIR